MKTINNFEKAVELSKLRIKYDLYWSLRYKQFYFDKKLEYLKEKHMILSKNSYNQAIAVAEVLSDFTGESITDIIKVGMKEAKARIELENASKMEGK